MPRLSDFILANVEPILVEWETFARSIWPRALTDHLNDPAMLRDHAEDILLATAKNIASAHTATQQSDKSNGEGDGGHASVRLGKASEAHGSGRVTSGFELWAVVAEYRALRATVIRLWRNHSSQCDVSDLDDVTRFNESIDQSLAQGVSSFVEAVDQAREKADVEARQRTQELRQVNEALLVSSVQLQETGAALRDAKEEAENANHAKDRFLATLSHELRTPLTPVALAVAAMEANPELPGAVRDDLAMVGRNVALEVKLIDDLLDLSRVTSGKLMLRRVPVDFNSVVRDACHTTQSLAQEKGVRLDRDLGANVGAVDVDPARLQQVVWNLVRNAAKFTPQGGRITVTTARTAGIVRVVVADTGMGVARDDLVRVFNAFEQGDASITREFGGMGLGLAISKSIVELHGGTIRADSAGPGRGSTFTVELPAPPLPAPAAAPTGDATQRGQGPGRDGGGLRVLLVEDHVDTARLLARLLGQYGHVVRFAHTAADALALAGRESFDLVVSDIGLPDGTGYDLMVKLRARHGLVGVAMSGYGMDEDVRRSRDAGFAEHLVKPVRIDDLERTLRRVATAEARQ